MTTITSENLKPCVVCGKLTNLIDYCVEQRLCGEECEKKYYMYLAGLCEEY